MVRGKSETSFTIERGDNEIDLYITGDGYYDPGRISGPPEDCYPPEGDMEIVSIETDDGPYFGELSDKEHDQIITALFENLEDEEDY